MNNGKLWDEALSGASYEELSEFAVEVPKVLVDSSVGASSEVVRSTGLVLTKNEIISIKKYASIAFSFPVTLPNVVDFLRYGEGENGGVGLKPEDFLATFQLVRAHADKWSGLRERIMLTATDLEMFGIAMRIWGGAMERFYDSDEAIALIKKYKIKTYEDLKKLEFEWEGVFPGIELDPDTLFTLDAVLQDIGEDILEYKNKANGIKVDLDAFGGDLEKRVIPAISSRLEFISKNKYTGEINTLTKTITERAADIERMNGEYKALVEKSLGSAASMNIFGLGMAIYLGVEAENIRAKRNELNKLQDYDIKRLESKNVTLGSLKRVEHDLQNCKIASVDAEVATNNLRYVWNVIDDYINKSSKHMAAIEDGLMLYKFMGTFQLVVASWRKVEEQAAELVKVFAEADKEYQENSLSSRNSRLQMFSSLEAVDYPALDLETMSRSKKQIRDGRAQATALSMELNYLPALCSRFGRRVDDVFDAARTLQQSADSSKRQLNDAQDEMAQLDKALAREISRGNDDAVEAINADRLQVLVDVGRFVGTKISDIKESYKNIAVSFSKSETESFALKLEADIQNAKAREDERNKELDRLRAVQASVDEAISLVEKNGIEEIGKDVNLTIEKLKLLKMSMPEIELVMMAIEQLQKTLEGIVRDISFLNLITQSSQLRGKIIEVQNQIAEQKGIVAVAVGKIEFINAVHGIDDQSNIFVAEYKKAVDNFELFDSAIHSGRGMVSIEEFLAEVIVFLSFLEPVSAPSN